MDVLSFHLSNINWWAVILATLVSFAVGGIWYSPAVMGKPWMKAMGIKPKNVQNADMTQAFLLTGILAFITATGLAVLMRALAFNTWQRGATFGLLVALVFVATNRGIHALFEPKGGLTLYIINAAHDIIYFTLAGAIIGAL